MPKEFDSSFHSILFSYLQTHLSLFPNSFKSPYKKKKIARSALDKSWIHRRTNIKTLCKCNERWIKCNERCRRRKGWGEDEKSKVIHGRKGREKGDVSRVSGRALPYVTSLRVSKTATHRNTRCFQNQEKSWLVISKLSKKISSSRCAHAPRS